MRMTGPLLTTVGLMATLLLGCGDTSSPPSASPRPSAPTANTAATTAALPESLFLAAAPEGGKSLNEIKQSGKNGEQVVVKARIAGRVNPFVDGRAVMIVADLGFPTCDEGSPMDKCPTPWDFCCSPNDQIAANTAAVQVVDADGKPIKTTLANAHGLTPGKNLVIAGVLKKSPDDAAVTINASGIFVVN